jgi:hypothetical protein
MTKRIAVVAAVVVFVLSLGANVFALTINDPGVVGSVYTGTQSSSVTNETVWANYLLSLGANTTVTTDTPGDKPPSNTDTETYVTGSTDYNGTVSGGVQGAAGDYTVDGNYQYALVKYDGQNAGYVLFDLSVSGNTLPEYSYSIWWNGTDTSSYQISHYTAFNPCTENCDEGDVPDGGSTVALLGSALFAFGLLGRRWNRA